MSSAYAATEPPRAEVALIAGPAIVEFGTPWCGYCRAAQPLIEHALASHPGVRHLKVEDGSGRPLGRSFRITLWPTLVFLRDGKEVSRIVRPAAADALQKALQEIDSATA